MKAKLFMPPTGQGYVHHRGKKDAPIINHYCRELAHKQLISQTVQIFFANLGNEEYWKSYRPAFCHARILFGSKFFNKIEGNYFVSRITSGERAYICFWLI